MQCESYSKHLINTEWVIRRKRRGRKRKGCCSSSSPGFNNSCKSKLVKHLKCTWSLKCVMSSALFEVFYFIFTTAYDIGTFSHFRAWVTEVQRSIVTQVVVIGEAKMAVKETWLQSATFSLIHFTVFCFSWC